MNWAWEDFIVSGDLIVREVCSLMVNLVCVEEFHHHFEGFCLIFSAVFKISTEGFEFMLAIP